MLMLILFPNVRRARNFQSQNFKTGLDREDARERRERATVQIRKDKKHERLAKVGYDSSCRLYSVVYLKSKFDILSVFLV